MITDSTMVFCTLFDRGYLDRGLLLYESLVRSCDDAFKLYVIAFDEDSYRVLTEINDKKLIVISRTDFESPELLEMKSNRTNREYLWTCSSWSIKYVLDTYDEPSCTYIDSDLFFYSTPRTLFEEIDENAADVGIMEHGYVKTKENARYVKYSGKYCVEFNYFRNNFNGMKVLQWWCDQCRENCSETQDGIHFGDQKYLEQFEDKFEGIYVFDNKFAGIAPWNLANYRFVSQEDNNDIYVEIKKEKTVNQIIFFHFQQLGFITKTIVDIHANMYPRRIDKRLSRLLYEDYIRRLVEKRTYLEHNYSINLYDGLRYEKRETFMSFLSQLIMYERDIVIFFRRIARWILYRREDYIGVCNEEYNYKVTSL